MSIEQKLKELNIELPAAPAAVANYVPYLEYGKVVSISGQLPMKNGVLQYPGIVGKDQTIENAQKAAEICAINILAQLKAACKGDLERVQQCVRLGVFVASAENFTDQPKVANAASNIMANVFGEKGRHTRAAVGSSSLPLNAAVEIEATFVIA